MILISHIPSTARHCKIEDCSASIPVLHPDFPFMEPYNLPCNAKPQPEMLFLFSGRITSEKSFKNPLFPGVRNSGTGVAYPKFPFASFPCVTQKNSSAFRCVTDSIVKKDSQHLFQPLSITENF